jgi:glutamyl-tRNA reductase
VEAVARAVMQRLLHEPTIRLKESGHGRQQVLRELFGLDEGLPEAHAPPAGSAPEAAAADNVRPLKRRA